MVSRTAVCDCGAPKRNVRALACKLCLENWECRQCGNVRPHGAHGLCKPCQKRKWREENPGHRDRGREWFLLKKYNLTLAGYLALLESQGNCCPCGKPAPRLDEPGRRLFHVDHDHSCCPGDTSCGKCVRGILCYSCNQALGNVRDDLEVLRRLTGYLETWYNKHSNRD